MTQTKPKRKAPIKKKRDREHNGETIIWGKAEGEGDWIKLPRTITYLGRYDSDLANRLQPRHILLLLNLAARKFTNKRTRAYWDELATDLGTKRATVRKWAYELEEMELLRITRHKGKTGIEGKPGRKNDRNTFDITPFVRRVEAAYAIKQNQKVKKKANASAEEEPS